MLRLIDEDDVTVGSAIFDAAQISPDYQGIRCVITLGSAGGVVCEEMIVEGAFREDVLRSVATEAVLKLDDSKVEGRREYEMTGVDGRRIGIDVVDDDVDPIDEEIAAMSEEDLDRFRKRLPWPWGLGLAITFVYAGAFAMWRIAPGDVVLRNSFVFMTVMTVLIVGLLIRACMSKISHDGLSDEMDVIIDRELDRRGALDAAIRKVQSSRSAAAPTTSNAEA
jgi:hypothetical protein